MQEEIQPQDQPPQKKEIFFFPIQRKQKVPPPLTEEEIDHMLRVQPASKPLYKENIPICSTTALPTK